MNLTTTARVAKSIPMSAEVLVDRLIAIRDELASGLDPVWITASVWKLVGEIEAPEPAPPPIRGGAPDDAEGDPAEWPAWTDADRWEPTYTGETPAEVLAASAPFNADYDAWLDRLDAARDCWTEADQVLAHGCA